MLALRYLRPRRKEAFISVIAGFSFLGILLGVATLVVVMAVMNGFRAELMDKILGINGHVVVQPMDTAFTDFDAVTKRIGAVPGVHLALPIIEGQALASGPSGNSSGVLVRGIRGPDLLSLDKISGTVEDGGGLIDFDAAGGVAIGTGLASSLGLTVGDRLTLISPRGAVTPMGTSPRIKTYPVAAIFQIGMSEYDSTYVFMPFAEAQAYFNSPDVAQAVEVYLDHPDDVGLLRGQIETAADRSVFSTDWRQRNVTFFSALEVERNVMFVILTMIVLVAALNIISGLIMLVKDKGSDIAILRTIGATRNSILRVFFITGGDDRDRGHVRRAGHRHGHLRQHRVAARVRLLGHAHGGFFAGTLFPLQAPGGGRCRRDGSHRRHGTDPDLSRHALSRLARRPPRSRGGVALRMSEIDERPQTQDPDTGSGAAREIDAAPSAGEREAIRLEGVARVYRTGSRTLEVLRDARLAVAPGEMVALVAPSGAGKSTLLHLAGLLEKPDAGEVFIAGEATSTLNDDARTAMRRTRIGFVYQFHHLLPEFSAAENLVIPQMIAGLGRREAERRAHELLSYLRIDGRASHRPAELSGGEQQRVAIARAVANAPRVLLADEPTGNLDPETASHVFGALKSLVRESGLAALIATHNFALAAEMDRTVTLRDGEIVPADLAAPLP